MIVFMIGVSIYLFVMACVAIIVCGIHINRREVM